MWNVLPGEAVTSRLLCSVDSWSNTTAAQKSIETAWYTELSGLTQKSKSKFLGHTPYCNTSGLQVRSYAFLLLDQYSVYV